MRLPATALQRPADAFSIGDVISAFCGGFKDVFLSNH